MEALIFKNLRSRIASKRICRSEVLDGLQKLVQNRISREQIRQSFQCFLGRLLVPTQLYHVLSGLLFAAIPKRLTGGSDSQLTARRP
jgi:hypothetical protein